MLVQNVPLCTVFRRERKQKVERRKMEESELNEESIIVVVMS